jgi:hypothetical protein
MDSNAQVACLHEMSVLFAKLKDYEFDERQCKKEIELLAATHVEVC